MFTPYDWQESIANRAQYIEGKLAQGVPVFSISISEGILLFTYRRQAKKIYDIYDRLVFTAIGQQSDVEALRVAAVNFAHEEGYNRSEQDVTVQRVATALSAPLKKAFADFGTAPLVARSLFAEVNAAPGDDLYYTLDYDGDYSIHRKYAILAGGEVRDQALFDKLAKIGSQPLKKALPSLRELWESSIESDEHSLEELRKLLKPEAVLLERNAERENRFRVLIDGD